jgi:ABC-type sugar transport system ATPase subunit
MAEIALRGVSKTQSRRYLLDNVDMTMRDGELTVLFGDADCGKVTALKVIAGIDKVSSGDVFVDGTAVTTLKGGRRDVAMVFEKQGLLPHKNVFDNIAFPLRIATDDGAEALRVADKIIVMAYGAVAQAAPPKQIYRRPADRDIAELFGTPPINLLPGEIVEHMDGLARVRLAGGSEISLPAYAKSPLAGAEVTVGIRPPHIKLEQAEGNVIAAKIRQKEISGGQSILQLDTPEGEITATVGETEADEVTLHLPADYCLLFDAKGRTIRRKPPAQKG